jgi:hypothetical protein
MSDNLRTYGRIDFHPPLPWSAYREFIQRPMLPGGDARMHAILRVDEKVEQIETDEGELTRRTALGMVPARPGDAYGAWGKTRHLAAELDELREWLLTETNSIPIGYLLTDTNDIGGIQRWWIEKTAGGFTDLALNWTVRREAAVLIWPDGASAVEPDPDRNGGWHYTATGRHALNHEADKVLDLQCQPERTDA